MKCNEALRLLKMHGWSVLSQRGSHLKMINEGNPERGVIIFPNHGSAELGKGFEKKIMKQAGIKK